MDVKPGYKHTDVGVIPEDWVVKTLGEFISLRRGHDLTEHDRRQGDIPVFGSAGQNGFHDTAIVKGSGIVLGRSGASFGQAHYCEEDFWPHNTALYITDYKGNSTRFVFYFLKSFDFSHYNSGGAQQSLNRNFIAPIPIAFPPTLAEQQAIAEVLSDADALIDSLEQLIAKKRLIKQGAMQELLRQKDDDNIRQLHQVSSLKGRIGWQGLKQTEFTTNVDEPFLITGMNFNEGAIRWNEVYHISEDRYEMAKEIQLKADDVLMTKDGTIGKMLYIDNIPYPGKASLNSHLLLFRPIQGSYNPKYLYYQLISKRFKDFVELGKTGTTFFGLSQAAVGKYPVLLPRKADQIRIASILSDMDAEIVVLEAKLDKSRQIKQGMMQELLTGRIRLV